MPRQPDDVTADLRAKAAEYRRLADAVRQPDVAARLLDAAEYFENIARRHPDETRPPIGGAASAGGELEGCQ